MRCTSLVSILVRTLCRSLQLRIGVIGLGVLAMPVFAQSPGSVEDMQRIIEAQQGQIEAQQKQLENLHKALNQQTQLLQDMQSQINSLAATKDGDEDEDAVAVTKPITVGILDPQLASATTGALISQKEKHDLESPTASNVSYFGPAAKAMIPGTETQVAVHGLVEFQMFHDTVGLNNNRFDTATIPVDGGPSQTKFNVNPTQLAVSTVTPVSQGQLNSWLSIDFNGQLDKPDPRLRIAFGEYVNHADGWAILLGQTYSTMLDMRAIPETLDFALPAGLWQLRQPLARYSKSIADSWTLEVSTESPENVSYEDAEKRTGMPDFVAAGTWLVGGEYLKHVKLAGVARDLQAEDDASGATDSSLGWAVSGSAKLGLPFLGARDSLKFTMHYGDGYGTQLKGGPKEGLFDPADSTLDTIGIFGTYGGIQHFWSNRFRSNLVYGYVNADNPDFVEGDTMKSTSYVAANIIWVPFPKASLGFEYLWGRRENENGESGTSSRFLLSSKYQF